MNIAGIGTIFSGGRGVQSFQSALENGTKKIPYVIPPEVLKDRSITRKMRRSDRFSRMAAISAFDAVKDSGINDKSLGVIVSTAFGPHTTTFKFLDGILDYGPNAASPTVFSNSVHNAAASYISSLLDIKGPTLTVTDFAFPFQNALLIAKGWLQSNKCDYVLLGAIDEYGEVLNYIYNKRFPVGDIEPFGFSPKSSVSPGEASAFLLLTDKNIDNNYCGIENISYTENKNQTPEMYIIDANGLISDEEVYKQPAGDNLIAGYSDLTGSMITGSAFNCVAGALMFKNRVLYGYNQKNPHGVNIPTQTEEKSMKNIHCIKYSCEHKKATVSLVGGRE